MNYRTTNTTANNQTNNMKKKTTGSLVANVSKVD